MPNSTTGRRGEGGPSKERTVEGGSASDPDTVPGYPAMSQREIADLIENLINQGTYQQFLTYLIKYHFSPEFRREVKLIEDRYRASGYESKARMTQVLQCTLGTDQKILTSTRSLAQGLRESLFQDQMAEMMAAFQRSPFPQEMQEQEQPAQPRQNRAQGRGGHRAPGRGRPAGSAGPLIRARALMRSSHAASSRGAKQSSTRGSKNASDTWRGMFDRT